MPVISFTHHAVERFIQRHTDGTMSIAEARQLLEEKSRTANHLREKTILGQAQWEITDPPCVLVTKPLPRSKDLVCVTVLPTRSVGGFSPDEMEIIREAAERFPKHLPPVPKPKAEVNRPPTPPRILEAKPPASTRNGNALETYRLQLEAATRKHEEKTKRHTLATEDQLRKTKRCLRATLRYLIRKLAAGDEEAGTLLQEIKELEPGFISEGFLGAGGVDEPLNGASTSE